jgi:hypothetical protein
VLGTQSYHKDPGDKILTDHLAFANRIDGVIGATMLRYGADVTGVVHGDEGGWFVAHGSISFAMVCTVGSRDSEGAEKRLAGLPHPLQFFPPNGIRFRFFIHRTLSHHPPPMTAIAPRQFQD